MNMKIRKGIWVPLSVLLALALLVPMMACAEEEEPAPAPAPAPAPTPAKEQPKSGGILQVPIVKAPGGYDMHRRPSYGPVLGYPVFSKLVYFDPNKRELSPDNLLPDLAERWETSADGKTVTFHLYKNVKWHDGQSFTADDVVYSLDKMVDAERSSISSYFPAYDGAVAVDDHTVKVSLKFASPSFVVQMAGPYCTIEAKHLADVDWKTTDFFVGTGPFMFKSYIPGVTYELVKNPNYHKKDEFGQQLPYLDGVTMYIIADRSAHGDALITNRVDLAMPVLAVFMQSVKEKVEDQAPNMVWDSYSNPYGMAWWFNQDHEPLKDIRVRQAMAMLLDRPRLRTAGFGGEDWGEYGRALFSTTYGLTTDEIYKMLGWDMTWDQRVAKAQELMAEAGYADGFKMRILVREAEQLGRVVTVLADIYERNLNLDVEVDQQDITKLKLMQAAGDYEFLLHDVMSYCADPDELVGYFETGSAMNFVGYSNPEVDRLIKQQSAEADLTKRAELVRQIETILLTDLPFIPGTFGKYWHCKWPYVKGFQLQDVGYGSRMAFEQVWLDK